MKGIFYFLLLVCSVYSDSEDCPDDQQDTQSFDGTCNNVNNKNFGKASGTFGRLCVDGEQIAELQCPNDNVESDRPGAQTACVKMFTLNNTDEDDGSYTALLTYFGQFVDHDITFTIHPEETCRNEYNITADSSGLCNFTKCFEDNQCAMTKEDHDKTNVTECYAFSKSDDGGAINNITSYLDLSSVYGSSVTENNNLRSGVDGKLRVTDLNGCDHDVLPRLGSGAHPERFLAGDARANENPILLALHTIFALEHNRIAHEIKERYEKKCENQLTDQEIFDIARRINIAQYQNIVINEYLPELEIKDLKDLKYNDSCSADIVQEFSTVAYRFGHTAVKNNFTFLDKEGNDVSEPLRDLFFNVLKFEEFCLGGVLEKQWHIASELIDNKFSASIGQHLFGQDLSLCALNVQRGRDHRVGSYKCILKKCGYHNLNTTQDLVDEGLITVDTKIKLDAIYGDNASTEKLDPFIMGLNEIKEPGKRLGPTFDCIVRRQFAKLVKCDRFFYTHCDQFEENNPDKYKDCKNQRKSINKRKFSDIFCDNLPNFENKKIPIHVFEWNNGGGRKERKCKNAKKIKFNTWLPSCPMEKDQVFYPTELRQVLDNIERDFEEIKDAMNP